MGAADEDLAVRLTSAAFRLGRVITAWQPAGLTASEMSILARLAERDDLTAAELARLEAMQPPSLSRHVKALTARHLIEQAMHPDDARRILITITDKGREELAEASRKTWLSPRIAAMGTSRRDKIQEAIRILEDLSG